MNKTILSMKGWVAILVGMCVSSCATAATFTWSGASGVDLLWGTGGNWSPNGPPGGVDAAVFNDTANTNSAGASAANNILAVSRTVQSLTYAHTNGFHNTIINPGVTLTLSNNAAAIPLLVGTESDLGASQQQTATISGPGGALVINNTNAGSTIVIRQAASASGSHRATLDMSGLDTFSSTIGRVLLAVQGTIIRPAGTWILANTNTITASGAAPAITLGDGGSNGGNGIMQLGVTNAFFADTMTVARQKSSSSLIFNPNVTNGPAVPVFYMRGRTTSRVSNISIGDNSAQSTSGSSTAGTINLSGGTADVQVDSVFIGRSQNGTGTGPATGTLTFNNGLIDVNTLEAGYQNIGTAAAVATGTVNVNESATLLVNTTLRLGRYNGSGTVPVGNLNINGGTVKVLGNYINGGGTANINLNSGLLDLQPAGRATPGSLSAKTISVGSQGIGVISNAASVAVTDSLTLSGGASIVGPTTIDIGAGTLDTFGLPGGLTVGSTQVLQGSGTVSGDITMAAGSKMNAGGSGTAATLTINGNVTLQGAALPFDLSSDPFQVGGANDLLFVGGNLTLSGTNDVVINAISGSLGSGTYRLFTYFGALTGDQTYFRVFGPLGKSRRTFQFSTATPNEVDITVGGSDGLNLTWVGDGSANLWDVGNTSNWSGSNGPDKFYNLDSVTFDDTGMNTPAINLTGQFVPGSLTVNNSSKNYTFSGAGGISGGTGLEKQGAASLSFNNSGTNSFTGAININGGSVSLGGSAVYDLPGAITINANSTLSIGGTGSSSISGPISLNSGQLIVSRNDNLSLPNTIAGGGTLSQQGSGVLTVSGANTAFDGAVLVSGGTLKAGNAGALGTVAGATTISSGAALDVNGFNLGLENVTVAGSGVGGAGAIINSGASVFPALANVTMSGNTTFGGTGRWDLRAPTTSIPTATLSTTANAYKLTKVGTNQVSIVGVIVDSKLGDIDVTGGVLSMEASTTGLGNSTNTLTIYTNSALQFYQITNVLSKVVVMNDGSSLINNNGTNMIATPITLNGSNNFNIGGTSLAISNAISGTGAMYKTGTALLQLIAANSWTGGTFIGAGTVQAFVSGSIPGDVVDNGTLSFSPSNSVTIVYNNIISGSGGVTMVAGADGTTVLGGANSFGGGLDINNGVLRVTHSSALGDAVGNTRVRGNITGTARVELTGGLNIAEPFLLECRQAPTTDIPHILNVNGTNTLTGVISGTTGGSDWNVQSDEGELVLTGDFNNTATSATRNLKLQGAGTGEWSGVISNAAGDLSLTAVVKKDSGTWVLSGANIYTGPTIVNGGKLLVKGTIGGGTVGVNDGGTLGGTGIILAPVTVNSGGTLSGGDGIGTLTIGGNLTFAGGSTNLVEVQKTGSVIISDLLQGIGILNMNGTLRVAASGNSLAAGDIIPVFSAGLKLGSFVDIDPPTPGPGLVWDTSALSTTGALKVMGSSVTPPHISSLSVVNGNVIIHGDGGSAGGNYYLLTSTNVGLPLASWTMLATNSFDGSGNFGATNAINPASPKQFFILQLP